jgi:uncharacterized protein (TIGR03435 family)
MVEAGSSAKKSTMAGFARMLVIFVKRPVVDQTGLNLYYDFDVKWSAPESADGQPPARSRSRGHWAAHIDLAGPVGIAPDKNYRPGE